MPTMSFVNLPVTDLERAKAFYGALGYSFNPQFSDETGACMVISDTIYAMLLTEPFFGTFTKKDVVDATAATEVITALSFDSREDVDRISDTALASGGSPANDPTDHGFMYSRSFQDPDGHLWEAIWMDPAHVE